MLRGELELGFVRFSMMAIRYSSFAFTGRFSWWRSGEGEARLRVTS